MTKKSREAYITLMTWKEEFGKVTWNWCMTNYGNFKNNAELLDYCIYFGLAKTKINVYI